MKPDTELPWTTWEELLLTCAVERHGVRDWDSVAMELQSRSFFSLMLTARACETKYHDLKRRFVAENDDVDAIPWLEELRRLRVAELKQEVLRYDLSIQSLELKVKRLEEERERSLKDDQNDDGKPDLEKNLEGERSENDKDDAAGTPEVAVNEDSDRESRSFNESNSTGNRGKEPEPVETVGVKPDPVSSGSKPTGEGSYNNSSDTVAKRVAAKASQERRSKKKPSQEKKGGDSAELRNTAGESKEGVKESSDVQSTASLTRRRRREKEVSRSGGGGDEPVLSPATIKREVVKSEPFVTILDVIRSHKHGSMFERRLKSQTTEEYKNTVRHHVDLDTIQTRLKKGFYFSSSTAKFHRDLLLLFTNATVFFPKASTESIAAYQLRDLVLQEIKNNNKTKTQRPDSTDPDPSDTTPGQAKPDAEGPEPSLSKQKSTAPIVVCRNRNLISAKPFNTQIDELPNPNVKNSLKMKEEESPTKAKTRERAVRGARSLRGSRNTQTTKNPNSNNGSIEKGEADPKINKKEKAEATSVKKRGAADFLKRIKRNSPAKGATMVKTVKSEVNNSGGRRETKKRGDGGKEAVAAKRGGGGKALKEESPSKRGVGRPAKRGAEAGEGKRRRAGGGAEGPRKRSRR
ncbi:Bromodomain-containing protein [Actinidia chinensis var. chinensis]|uniref:Bromodomain-containing protein n=1 Tax=Actinidia chinensis var. chinensis TaxID=1590841 RepID=A0A2R6RD09_ACTCC|nr:Bromodomain-containing protein [Actinidia chinensis var. chinensis]